MKKHMEKNELFSTSTLMILVSYTIFAIFAAFASLMHGWEMWAMLLISAAVLLCWVLHIQGKLTDTVKLWTYSILMMVTFFFYGIHETSIFDLAVIMGVIIILFTMMGNKLLISLCQLTYYVTIAYDMMIMLINGEAIGRTEISRIVLHAVLIFLAGWVSRQIIEKWIRVLENSRSEIEQLTDSTERLNDFLANVSHELRTPINAVIGLSSICSEKEQDDAVRQDLQAINAAGQRVAEQISDILDYSETDRNRLARCDEDYMLSSVLNDLANELRPHCPKELELIIDVDPAIPTVMYTDVGKLKKILRHLIMNGLKYTKEGGVYVRIFAVKEEYGVNLCIEVTDTGVGMSPEELERVTERFYQADSGRTRSSNGLGLGMVIVSGFTRSLGGFLTIESKVDKGTTVRVSLPQKVLDDASCMSVAERERLCLGAFLHFEKFANPEVREYYNIMVRNIVRGLGVQMHRVDNAVNLKKLLDTVSLTHLFVGEEEYETDVPLMESLARRMHVIIVATKDFKLPAGSRARIMEKPFYCFPVAAVLNEGTELDTSCVGQMRCVDVKALVVDDEPMNLTVARSILGKYGIEVITADSGIQAVEMCSEDTYDIVFMDHMMPGMDGVEAMKRIRSAPNHVRMDVPIVALTANAVSTAREMFIREGFDGFVSKPIDLVELERVLRKVLPTSKIVYVEPDAPAEAPAEAPAAAQSAAAPAAEAPAAASPYEILAKCGVDVQTGLKYSMQDDEFYQSLLLQFASEAKEKRADMERFFEDKAFHDYEILVHALKSTSKMIGCEGLSEAAKALEFAAKEQDAAYIEAHHAAVMKQYDSLTAGIEEAYGIRPDAAEEDEVLEFAPEDRTDEVLEFAPEDRTDDVLEFAPEEQTEEEILEFEPEDEQ